MSYVGSAVHHIGIPISLWDGFLDLCEWAAAREDWQSLSGDEWETTVTRLSGSRRRLRSFLLSNRQGGTEIIREMLDARRCLASDPALTVDQLKQACLLRVEYFDEVPETAEFLKPNDPESLFRDRPRLVWKDQNCSLVLHLPGLDRQRLPATWNIAGRPLAANATPAEIAIDSAAFAPAIPATITAQSDSQAVRLPGLNPWGLFDMERGGYWINTNREELPLRSYVLIATKPVQLVRRGFEEADCPANDRYELPDGTSCYLTRLWPKDRFAAASIADGAKTTELRFRTRKRVQARLFVGQGWHSARFRREGDSLNIEKFPLVCVLVPLGYFANSEQTVQENFIVQIDGHRAGGSWERRGEALEDYELFFWSWSKRPLLEKVRTGKATNLRELGKFFEPMDLQGHRILTIEATRLGIRFAYDLWFENPRIEIERCWRALPGNYLLWFLLAQSREGLKWDELALASHVIAPDTKVSYYLLKKYLDVRLIIQRGRCWAIAESRAILKAHSPWLTMRFCGDPSILWGLYRKMYHLMKDKLPPVSIVDQRGEPPFVQIEWPAEANGEIYRYLKSRGARVVNDLWNP
jgi:hypothetical protein